MGYLRRSTDRQEQSIPDQQRALERFAAERGLSILRFYTDDAVSGTSALARKAFQQLIADAQSSACDFASVLVYDVKRFGRLGNDEAGYYRHLLSTSGVEVLYASEGFNGGETDDLLRPVKQWQARQESKDLSKVTIRGLLSKAEGGWWLGGVAPHGYDLAYQNERGEFLFILRHEPDGSKLVLDGRGELVRTLARGEGLNISKRDRARLVPGEASRVETVRTIFRLYAQEGLGLSAVADHLNRHKIPTPRGSAWSHIYAGQWRDSTVRAILVNPLYAGDMVWNRRTDARFHSISGGRAVERKQAHGARLVPNAKADWVLVPGTHEGLVSRELFELAQKVREGRPSSMAQAGVPRAVGGWSGVRARFALSGLVACGICGGRYQGVTRTKGKPRLDGSKVRTFSYGCGSYIAKGTSVCAFNPVPQAQLEELVISAVLEYYGRYAGSAGRKLLTGVVQEALGVREQDLKDARARLESERKGLEGRIAHLLDHLTERTRDLVEERLGLLREERTLLELRAGELERLAGEQVQVQERVRECLSFLGSLEAVLRDGPGEHRQRALRTCVREVRVDKPVGVATLTLRCVPGVEEAGDEQMSLCL